MSEETKNVDMASETGISVRKRSLPVRILCFLLKSSAVLASIALMAVLLSHMVLNVGSGSTAARGVSDVTVMDKFDMFMTNEISKIGRAHV